MDIGFTEIVFVAVLALVLFGPKKFPTLARDWGRTLHRLKRDILSAFDKH